MKQIRFAAVCFSLCLLAACKKDSAVTATNQTVNNTIVNPSIISYSANTGGFGSSMKPLTGTPYTLPAGISMSGSITTSINSCTSNQYYECNTTGTLSFYMTLVNNNNLPTTIIFPAGLVLPSLDTIHQGAILVQPDTFTMPGGSSLCVSLDAECINEHRTFNDNMAYGAPLITNNTNYDPLILLLSKKQTIVDDPSEVIQKAVWDIADSGRMTPADAAAMNSFP